MASDRSGRGSADSRRRFLRTLGAGTVATIAAPASATPGFLRAGGGGGPVPSAGTSGEVWMSPTSWSSFLRQLTQRPDAWEWVRTHLDGLAIHLVTVPPRPDAIPDYRDGDLERLVDLLNAANVDLAVELSGPWVVYRPFDDGIGERAIEGDTDKLQRIVDAGGAIDHVKVDAPVRDLLKGYDQYDPNAGFETVDRCLDEVVDYLQGFRDRFPGTDVHVISNFPNWGWKGEDNLTDAPGGDYLAILERIVSKTDAGGVPIAGVVVDNPYEYGRLDRVGDLERELDRRSLSMNLVVNSEGGNESGGAFAEKTRRQLDRCLRRGLSPQRWTVQSWYEYPQRNVPESDGSTMTGVTKDVIERLAGRVGGGGGGGGGGGRDGSPGRYSAPLYRLFHPGKVDHFYTTSDHQRAVAEGSGYRFELEQAFVHDRPVAGTTPLYRLYKPPVGDHFYTVADSVKRSAVEDYGYRDEGIAAYVYADDATDRRPLYRLVHPEGINHFYTTNPEEKRTVEDGYGYRFERIECYVI